jgi:glycosyltransferase involved in cell wall biosynthesis
MPGVPREEVLDGLSIRRFGYPFVIAGWQPYLKRFLTHIILLCKLLLLREKFDFILGQGSPLLFGRLYSAIYKVPIVSVVHDVYSLEFSIASKGAVKGLARHVLIDLLLPKLGFDLWIAVSKTTARKLGQLGVAHERVKIVYNGINPGEYTLSAQRRRDRICYVGRLVEHKHVEDLIDAFGRLQRKSPGLELVIVGDGDQRESLEAKVKKARLREVVFTGFVSQREKEKLLSSSLCLVLPSTAEGWAVVLTEAAASGIPSVAYATPGVVEQASMIPSIITVPERDINSLESAISRLLCEKELARRLGTKGREASLAFTWDRSADMLLAEMGKPVLGAT